MAVKEVLAATPWWVKWVAVPLIALVVFGGMIAHVVGMLIKMLFIVLLCVAVVGGVLYLVRRLTSASSSSHDRW